MEICICVDDIDFLKNAFMKLCNKGFSIQDKADIGNL